MRWGELSYDPPLCAILSPPLHAAGIGCPSGYGLCQVDIRLHSCKDVTSAPNVPCIHCYALNWRAQWSVSMVKVTVATNILPQYSQKGHRTPWLSIVSTFPRVHGNRVVLIISTYIEHCNYHGYAGVCLLDVDALSSTSNMAV